MGEIVPIFNCMKDADGQANVPPGFKKLIPTFIFGPTESIRTGSEFVHSPSISRYWEDGMQNIRLSADLGRFVRSSGVIILYAC